MTARAESPLKGQGAVGGRVAEVAEGSAAELGGLLVGDLLISADGHPLADVLDWQWYADGPAVQLVVERQGGEAEVRLTRQVNQQWGIEFADALFDGVRTCRNKCAFCFVSQLPSGLRPALYVRDDDFRLSFLHGNFISLTNLSDADVARIIEERLSPLYFSLHAVSPAVRRSLICAAQDLALDRADQLLAGGIDLHVQIVLVPGVNDGEELEASLEWLARRPGVLSVGIVPLGYTRYQASFSHSYEGREAARPVIDRVARWHDETREKKGFGWVYLADEFYLAAGRDLPAEADYDGFPQYENGIGLTRSFVDEAALLRQELKSVRACLRSLDAAAVLVTGELFAPVLEEVLRPTVPAGHGDGADCDLRILGVSNRFFGGNVSVAGLLTGTDIEDAVCRDAKSHGGRAASVTYLVPDVVQNDDGMTLDDVAVSELGQHTGQQVRLVSSDARGLLEGLAELASPSP